MKTILLALVLASSTAFAQDAAQQAMQASQMSMQAAQQASQLATQQSMQAAQQANQMAMQAAAQAPVPGIASADTPSFSVPAGTVPAGTAVRLKTRTRYAVIFYTTNGWTPTAGSQRYTGPITINSTTHLQAIAVASNMNRSLVANATYVVAGGQPTQAASLVADDGVLRAGTPLRLVIQSGASSKSAQIGDELSVQLDEDVVAAGAVFIPRGTPISATISRSDHAGAGGTPGDMAFEVHSLETEKYSIPLYGGETIEGANHYKRVKGFILVPYVGVAALAIHGEDAVIQPGMTLTATVAEDVQLD